MNSEAEFTKELSDWLRSAVGSNDCSLQLQPMKGAGSSSVNLLLLNGQPRYVLRLHTNRQWLKREPDLITHEAAALDWMSRSDLPSPRCIAIRESAPPAVLMSLLTGEIVLQAPDIDLWLNLLARALAEIHACQADGFPWQYKSWTRLSEVKVPPWTSSPANWQMAVERRKQAAPAFAPVFIHRDFHPLNVLWRSGRVSGIVDWVNGCSGPAAVDVAHCRLNLALMYGGHIAERFLRFYQGACPGYEHDPYWDLDAVLGWLPEPFFYEPWADFGLPRIAAELLRSRMDAYLFSIVSRLG